MPIREEKLFCTMFRRTPEEEQAKKISDELISTKVDLCELAKMATELAKEIQETKREIQEVKEELQRRKDIYGIDKDV